MPDRDPASKQPWRAVVGFFALNLGAVAGSVVLVQLFQNSSTMVVCGIPILLSGWLFGRFEAIWSALFLLISGALYFRATGQDAFADQTGLLLGMVSYSIFAGAGFALRSVRDLYEKNRLLAQEVNRKNRELRESSLKDPLTDLHNRRYVDEYIAELATTFLRQLSTPEFALRKLGIDEKVILVMIADIDHFKRINDAHGHGGGDQALVEVSRRIRDSVRFDDTVIRWGGEEFLVVCPMVDRSNAERVLQKVLDGVRTEPVRLADGAAVDVTISMGAIWLPVFQGHPFAISFERSVLLADHALYDAKTHGRNQAKLIVGQDTATAVQGILSISLEEFYRDPQRCSVVSVG